VAVQSSQQEQQLLREFLDGETRGFFVEVGVSQPTEGSQTWPLEQVGWTGILIEPQPDIAAFLVTARRNAKVFAVACGSRDDAGQPVRLRVSGVHPGDRAASAAATGYVVAAPTRTLDSILEEGDAPVPLDLLAVDAGDGEIDVLGGFNFRQWQPLLIVIENGDISLRTHRLLRNSGYRLIRRLDNSAWYVPEDDDARMPRSERWAMLRSYYLAAPFRAIRRIVRRSTAVLSGG
jgi:methyltransferase FkbM-like protein